LSEDQRIVVIGASAGGVEALLRLVRDLPADFPAAVCIVLHIPPDAPSLLAHILGRESKLPVAHAEDRQALVGGRIYIAPPDRHLLVGEDGMVQVARGPRENRHRPAVDPLFRSAALAFGPRAIAVVLTGTLDDGTAGALAVKERGGIVVVQDPAEALYPGMPQSVVRHVDVDHVVPINSMGETLARLVRETVPSNGHPPSHELRLETGMAALDPDALARDDRPGHPSPYSCPDCGGVLWQIEDGEYVRYRCRVGHAFAPETMLSAQEEQMEEALWSAAKTLEETARLSAKLALSERARGHEWLADRFAQKERDARSRVEVIRRYLLRGDDATVPVELTTAS
jgi:two-component system chemotaxis response regulator CheB